MAKVYLDPGHGGGDPGAVGHGLREKDIVLKIARYARDYLLNNYENVQVRMSRTGDTYPSLSGRASDANRWGADVFVSIHINAASASAKGYEDFIYNGSVSNNTHKLQDALHKQLAPLFPTNRGQKRANFAVLRLTRMPAVLTECGFITNKRDADYLRKDSNLKKLGESHAVGIAKHLGLKKKTKPKQKKGGLTVQQYNELKNENARLKDEIDELKEMITGQDGKEVPSEWAEPVWDKKVMEGYFDGTRPLGRVQRQELAAILDRLTGNINEYHIEPLKKRVDKLEK